MQRSEKSELYKIKKHKDLSFLLHIQEQTVSDKVKKYILTEGEGPALNEIKVPLTAYFSFEKYDYTGKFVSRTENKSHSFPIVSKEIEYEDSHVAAGILTMKVNEKSWFNVQLHEKESTVCAGYPGFHYQVILDKFIYKNDDNFESKRLIYEENREKAKVLFQKKNFKEALKIYKHSINILSSLSKKFLSEEELKILREYYEKSETNFIKCVAKLNGFGGRYDKEIGKQAKSIVEKNMRKNPESVQSFYQKAIYMKYECRFSDAEEAIKEGFQKKFS